MTRTRSIIAAALTGALALPLSAQDEKPAKPPIRPQLEDVMPGAGSDPRREMVELFQSIETRLREMGAFLQDAAAGDTTRLADVEASGIDELLDLAQPGRQSSGGVADLLAASRGHGGEVLKEIDRILEIAAENGGT